LDFDTARHLIVAYGRRLYANGLTDSVGGNLSIRLQERVFITPRGAASEWRWELSPSQVLVTDLSGQILAGDGEASRESAAHLALQQAFFPRISAVMHSHPNALRAFYAKAQPMPLVLDELAAFGLVPYCQPALEGTQALAEAVLDAFGAENTLEINGASACLLPGHGLFVIARDMARAYEITDLLDLNAYALTCKDAAGERDPDRLRALRAADRKN
jgi:L-fuculose-phosphate aldolase